ncbi:Protein of unknown function [Gillisia sp. Hel1_33_143]|uniref:DUF2911 domain-containing protein n=1 Tax=Gillisia sp. Hel1_33_143 TaxID=1336796 RepID=UPI00087933A5|nr:DUF2911 domain-containing protein [Gillisia sp. Hel1_33_143]SDS22154.1 Protein of unknown function [Gillisia sp. Hel1_33_143]
MKKNILLGLKILVIIMLIVLGKLFYDRYATKAYSPEETITYEDNSLELEVFYNRPYKKNRKIFGGLIPYGEVWRTGANEATTFSTNEDLIVDGSILESGKYTLWTIPMENSWKVIFNSKMYPWGINLDKQPYREPEFDVLVIEIPTEQIAEPLEQFSIYFEKDHDFVDLTLSWDYTKIRVPIIKEKEASKTPLSYH